MKRIALAACVVLLVSVYVCFGCLIVSSPPPKHSEGDQPSNWYTSPANPNNPIHPMNPTSPLHQR